MTIIPVLDIMNGQAVHAVGGIRSAYQPLRSRYCESSCPLQLSTNLRDRFGIQDCYVADLDGIINRNWNLGLLSQMSGELNGLRIDAGIREVEDCFALGGLMQSSKSILASESLTDCSVLESLVGMVDPARLVFSLDLFEGQLNAPPGAWGDWMLSEIVDRVVQLGVRELIVLDLASVGGEAGPTTVELCAAIRKQHPELLIITGGGVRDQDDLRRLEDAGVDAVLVGTALHRGDFPEQVLIDYCSNR